jgi:hypothetical protein
MYSTVEDTMLLFVKDIQYSERYSFTVIHPIPEHP